jgi:hypothetical protein
VRFEQIIERETSLACLICRQLFDRKLRIVRRLPESVTSRLCRGHRSRLQWPRSPLRPDVKLFSLLRMKARLCIGPALFNPFTGAGVNRHGGASAAQNQSQGFFLVPGSKIVAIDATVTFDIANYSPSAFLILPIASFHPLC